MAVPPNHPLIMSSVRRRIDGLFHLKSRVACGHILLVLPPWEPGPNCVVLQKCSEATRKKLKVLDTDPDYKVMQVQPEAAAQKDAKEGVAGYFKKITLELD